MSTSIDNLTIALSNLEAAATSAGITDIAHHAYVMSQQHSAAGQAKSLEHLKSPVSEMLRVASLIVKHPNGSGNPNVEKAGHEMLAALGQVLVDTNTAALQGNSIPGSAE